MNLSKFLSILMITSNLMVSAGNHGVYYAELEAYKQSPAAKEMFDEDAHSVLATIQRDVTLYKNLTSFQRWVRQTFLECDVVIVTPDTLPTLYAYVDAVCKKANITTPTIFVTRQDGFFNAFAQKWLMSSGAIVIGQKLMHELSDESLEAVVAHEIGHIKYNHSNKRLLIRPFTLIITGALFVAFLQHIDIEKTVIKEFTDAETGELIKVSVKEFNSSNCTAGLYLASMAASLLPAFLIGKRFEKQADEFACNNNGKAEGIIEFCKLILKKEELREEEFVAIYSLLQENKENLTFSDYYFDLVIRYYLAKFGHNIDKVRKFIYRNTFLGAHPSPEARIAAAQKYLQQEA